MKNYLVEATAGYKMGHQRFEAKTSIIGRNILRIEAVPEDVPEYADGLLSRVQLASGEIIFCKEPYARLVEIWSETLQEAL